MTEREANSRNEALEFARRARCNLDFIEDAAEGHASAEVHVVTQLVLSLLGMVVIPKEKLLLDEIAKTELSVLAQKGWPRWKITLDGDSKRPTYTLGRLLEHIRNAVAHGRITFTSDSPRIDEVGLLVEDKWKREDAQPYWRAEIEARDLKVFCHKFLDFIDNTIG